MSSTYVLLPALHCQHCYRWRVVCHKEETVMTLFSIEQNVLQVSSHCALMTVSIDERNAGRGASGRLASRPPTAQNCA